MKTFGGVFEQPIAPRRRVQSASRVELRAPFELDGGEQMQALAEEMYNTLMDLDWSGIDKDTMKKYLEGGELDRGDDFELYDMAFDEIEERLLLRHGAFYPEDESTDAAVQIENRINNDMFNAQYMR